MDLRKRPLVAGAAALFVAGVANRIIGTLYRVLLVRTAGEEVVGLMQMTWPIYKVAWTLATAGLYVAIARLSADALGSRRPDQARAYGRVGLALTLGTALLSAGFLLATRHLFANHFLTDPRTGVTLAILPLLLVPAALSHSLRGVLQGQERLTPVAVSNLLEACARVPIVLFLVAWLLPHGAEWAAGGIAIGLVAGELLSLLYLGWCVRRSWRRPRDAQDRRAEGTGLSGRSGRSGQSERQPARPEPPARSSRSRRSGGWWASLPGALPTAGALTALAVPVLVTGLINGILGMFNVALIPRQLMAAGLEASEATTQYGRLFGMALPILYMPLVAVHPLAHAAVPAVARRVAAGRSASVRLLLVRCFAVAGAVGLVSSLAFWRYGEELGQLLYGTAGLGALIAPLAVAAPFAYLGHIGSAVLYGLGRTGVTMVNGVIGNLVRLGLIVVLVSDPDWGIVGALWAVVADYVLTACLNLAAVRIATRKALASA